LLSNNAQLNISTFNTNEGVKYHWYNSQRTKGLFQNQKILKQRFDVKKTNIKSNVTNYKDLPHHLIQPMRIRYRHIVYIGYLERLIHHDPSHKLWVQTVYFFKRSIPH